MNDCGNMVIMYIFVDVIERCDIMKKKGVYELMRDKELLAVHDDDLVSLLKALGKHDDVMSGNCQCVFCKKRIDIDNLGSIIPIDAKVEFSCNDDRCLSDLVRFGGKNES